MCQFLHGSTSYSSMVQPFIENGDKMVQRECNTASVMLRLFLDSSLA